MSNKAFLSPFILASLFVNEKNPETLRGVLAKFDANGNVEENDKIFTTPEGKPMDKESIAATRKFLEGKLRNELTPEELAVLGDGEREVEEYLLTISFRPEQNEPVASAESVAEAIEKALENGAGPVEQVQTTAKEEEPATEEEPVVEEPEENPAVVEEPVENPVVAEENAGEPNAEEPKTETLPIIAAHIDVSSGGEIERKRLEVVQFEAEASATIAAVNAKGYEVIGQALDKAEEALQEARTLAAGMKTKNENLVQALSLEENPALEEKTEVKA